VLSSLAVPPCFAAFKMPAHLIGILTYSSQANVCVTSQYTSEKPPFHCALCGPFAILRSAGSQPSPLSVSALYNVISASTVCKNYIHFFAHSHELKPFSFPEDTKSNQKFWLAPMKTLSSHVLAYRRTCSTLCKLYFHFHHLMVLRSGIGV